MKSRAKLLLAVDEETHLLMCRMRIGSRAQNGVYFSEDTVKSGAPYLGPTREIDVASYERFTVESVLNDEVSPDP